MFCVCFRVPGAFFYQLPEEMHTEPEAKTGMKRSKERYEKDDSLLSEWEIERDFRQWGNNSFGASSKPVSVKWNQGRLRRGGCGACTVVIGEVREGKVHYKSVAGCLYLAAKLEGKHLFTNEGLAQKEKLHPIQEAVLNAHATQCGFCTPGVNFIYTGSVSGETKSRKEESADI